jgi:hypothetical protein
MTADDNAVRVSFNGGRSGTAGLARINGTFVIARSTAFTYKGKPVDVKQIGRDPGVRYLLEGGEQRSGNQPLDLDLTRGSSHASYT